MFISKFWTLLITLLGVVMLSVIILARDVVNRERVENATAILFKEVSKADVQFKLHARMRLDKLLSVTFDPAVQKSLGAASAKPANADSVRDELLAALRKQNKQLEQYEASADLLAALDINGTVIAQTGEKERQHSYNLAGFPAVDAALRGYVRDDVWKLDKEVFLIATRPVILGGRYVGAVLHAMKVTDAFATKMSKTVQVGMFAGNLMLAVGTPQLEGQRNADGSLIANRLSEVFASKQYQEKGYSEVQRLETDRGDYMAVYTKVRGEAAANQVGYVVVVPLHQMSSPTEFYDRAAKQDIDALPKVWLILGFIVLTLVAWGWMYLEGQRPVSKLYKSIQDLSKSDPKDQLNVYRYRRKIRKIAVAINGVIDYKMKSLLEDSGQNSKSIDSILGAPEEDDGRLSSASFKFLEPSSSDVPPPPPADNAEPSSSLPLPTKEKLPPPREKSGGVPPTPPKQRVPSSKEEVHDEETYFHQIFDEFVAMKRDLGESVDQLTFEKFKVTLTKNRDTLKARYGCSSVKFQVYEKNGKASLKATPVKS